KEPPSRPSSQESDHFDVEPPSRPSSQESDHFDVEPSSRPISRKIIESTSKKLQKSRKLVDYESSPENSMELKRRRSEVLFLPSKSRSPSVLEPSGDDILAKIMIPKSQRSVNIEELRDLEHRRIFDEKIYEMETSIIENSFKIKKTANEIKKIRRKKSDPEESYAIKEEDRIFSGASVSFQPLDIFGDDDKI
uniref:Uncharacterized protein n=1 Tax=Panagrolaimus sp. ES5 TaxID=591445 RepID=A0AC34FWP5_9BILA